MKLRTLLLSGIALTVVGVLAAQAQLPGVNSNFATVFTYMYEASTNKPTYSSTMTYNNGQVPASARETCTLRGSATKTLRVRRVIVGGNAGAVTTEPIAINKYSAVGVGGVQTVGAMIPYDSQWSASTALTDYVTTVYTTRPTLVGTLTDFYVVYGNGGTGTGNSSVIYDFGQLASPVILRGVAQSLAVDLGTFVPTGLQFSCTFEWTEYNESSG